MKGLFSDEKPPLKTGKRVQRKRCAGWKMPLNTVYVGRPTKYGNPWKMEGGRTRIEVIAYYELHLKNKLQQDPHFLDELKGKDLACWCPLDKPCHAVNVCLDCHYDWEELEVSV